MIKKGTYVQIRAIILEAGGERASGIPEDTAGTPLVMWVKGHLLADTSIGCEAKIETATGRIESGILEEVEPMIALDYGRYIPELMQIAEAATGRSEEGCHEQRL